jgi:cbb3-type cytochrome oxidase subunit 3
MKLSDIMSAAGLASWAEIALILSLITFGAIVAYVFVIRSKASYEDARRLPLEDDEPTTKPIADPGSSR